jgi:DNA-binding NarL/FixJ family response regulator
MSDSLESATADPLSQQPIRVIVADDHPLVRRGIIHELLHSPEVEVLGEAVNGDSALRLAQMLTPDVLLLDISMPGLATVEVLRQLVADASPVRVLVLTAHADIDHILSMIKAGALGYMLKDEDPALIITALRSVMRGETWMSVAVMTAVVNHTARETVEPVAPMLSQREREVLEQLATGKENQEIGQVLDITERTVRFHLRNIYDKLGVRRGEAIAWGVRNVLSHMPMADPSGD